MRRFKTAWLVCVILLSCALTVLQAAEQTVTFDKPEQATFYNSLLRQYRCLKCQNQNLADSQASLAEDLRREIRTKVLEGKSQSDIDAYLVARYGEFVFYRPRFNSTTAILWLGPFVLLLIGLAGIVVMIRRREGNRIRQIEALQASVGSKDDQAAQLVRARHLLDE